MSGGSKSAVAGVMVAIVDGVSAASTACESDVNVTIGGRIGGGWPGGVFLKGPSGLPFGEGRPLGIPFALGDGDCCALPRPPKDPKDSESRLEKLLLLLCVEEDLLETVDWDHRFRFPTPSRTPLPLSERG